MIREITPNPIHFTKDTKVLLSFGARDGGFEFARQLRELLMRARGWTDPCAIYLDAVSARSHPSSTTQRIVVEGHGVNAYRNPQWRELYQAAMRNAKAMVFIATPAWARSVYCADEYQMFEAIRAGRHDVRIPLPQHLPIVAVVYEQALALLGKSDRMIALGAARVSSFLASIDPSRRLVLKNIHHAYGALIVLKQGQTAATVAPQVDAALHKLGV